MSVRKARRTSVALIIFICSLLNPLNQINARAGTSGFRVRKTDGDSLPGAVSFTPRSPSGKASSIISSVQSRSQNGTLISYFPRYVQTEIRDRLRDDTPEHAVTLRGYTVFTVKGYRKSVGSVVMRVEAGTSTSSAYRYVGLLGVIYDDGDVDWHTIGAKIYSSGTFAVTLGSALCATLSADGRSAVLLIIGESYRWW
ncbi:MAG: hypothetical protein LBB86_05805 [Oscillospiraceae bacterium]|nr:hypothetical protein [Oscillospiraceae bacterium]